MKIDEEISQQINISFWVIIVLVLILIYQIIFKIIVPVKNKIKPNYPNLIFAGIALIGGIIFTKFNLNRFSSFKKNKCVTEGITLGTSFGGGGKHCGTQMHYSYIVDGIKYRDYECIGNGTNNIRDIGIRVKYKVYYDCTNPSLAFINFDEKIENNDKFIEQLNEN